MAEAWEGFKTAPDSIMELCEHVAAGGSLASFARELRVPYTTILGWIDSDPARVENYARARETRADFIFDQLDEVSDQAASAETAVEVAGLRLKADNIKWKLARMAPKKYGDKVTVGGDAENPLVVATAMTDAELMAIAAGLKK